MQCEACQGPLGEYPRGSWCEPCWIERMRQDYGEEKARTAWHVHHPHEPFPTKQAKKVVEQLQLF